MAVMEISISGLAELYQRANSDRLIRQPLRKGLRIVGNSVKRHVVRIATPVGRSLARRVSVKVDRHPTPRWVRIANRAAWVHVGERGRRPGAKRPPAKALRGGFAAAKVVAERGLPGYRVMERAANASQPDLHELVGDLTRGIQRAFGAG